jgi:1-deoxy-D-xylulose-5-phosphate reductoisomerase
MSNSKNICILGSTGSIGQNSLEVIARFQDRFSPKYLSTNKNIDLLSKQVELVRPKAVAVLDEQASSLMKHRMNGSVKVFTGEKGLLELVGNEDIDIVINALVGFAGLKPTIEAIKNGSTIALANKETLVVAGNMITQLAQKHGSQIIPIDSEHSAILQCLIGERRENISRLILTASGGPFLHRDKNEFADVSIQDALRHPNWKMGNKITIDSATMMNKGLEIIEAHWLFNLPPEKIEVLIHPQSVIHSMVEFIDGSVKAQLGVPDMKIPIQYALTYPERAQAPHDRVDFAKMNSMTFFKPDMNKFECLELAYRALKKGGPAPIVLNAANEVAVEMFLNGDITFDRIPTLVRNSLESMTENEVSTLDDIVTIDADTRRLLRERINAKRYSVESIKS